MIRARDILLTALLLFSVVVAMRNTRAAEPLPRFGIGVDASTLGAGIQAATAVTRRSNVRAGFHAFVFGRDFSKDGISYGGELNLLSGEILYDQYLFRGFHVSPGLIASNGQWATANATVPGGHTFSLGGTTYSSSGSNPVTGTGSLDTRMVAPMILIGVGNLLPRSSRHVTFNFDLGVVFQGSPRAALRLNGSACNPQGTICQDVATTPVIQTNVQAEQTKLTNSVSVFKYYPVISFGVGYKF